MITCQFKGCDRAGIYRPIVTYRDLRGVPGEMSLLGTVCINHATTRFWDYVDQGYLAQLYAHMKALNQPAPDMATLSVRLEYVAPK